VARRGCDARAGLRDNDTAPRHPEGAAAAAAAAAVVVVVAAAVAAVAAAAAAAAEAGTGDGVGVVAVEGCFLFFLFFSTTANSIARLSDFCTLESHVSLRY
jgi:hypothetical protein